MILFVFAEAPLKRGPQDEGSIDNSLVYVLSLGREDKQRVDIMLMLVEHHYRRDINRA